MTAEGLTQESHLLCENLTDGEEDKEEADNVEDNKEADNVFADSLLEDDSSSLAMASTRDILKPQINEVLQCLDTLKSKISIKKATKLMNNLANELHLELGKSSGSKRNIDLCCMVNINIKENASRKSRTYASKNC
jgi:hypothetical protein